ncbi:DUF5590 domain-containing protein [Fredinandcohnia humi]
MKKWIIIILIVCCIIIWRGCSIYQSAMEPVKVSEQKATKIALEETSLQTIKENYTYYGTSAYLVVIGSNEDGDEMIVWIPEEKGEILTRLQSEGITEKEAVAIVREEREVKEIRSVKLGIEDEIPIWEIIYIGSDNRLTYHKLYFETGKYRNSIKP